MSLELWPCTCGSWHSDRPTGDDLEHQHADDDLLGAALGSSGWDLDPELPRPVFGSTRLHRRQSPALPSPGRGVGVEPSRADSSPAQARRASSSDAEAGR